MSLGITSYCSIKKGLAKLNGETIFNDGIESDEFIKGLYRHLKIGYPKFFKMDRLSRLAFVASEILLKEENLSDKYSSEKNWCFSC